MERKSLSNRNKTEIKNWVSFLVHEAQTTSQIENCVSIEKLRKMTREGLQDVLKIVLHRRKKMCEAPKDHVVGVSVPWQGCWSSSHEPEAQRLPCKAHVAR